MFARDGASTRFTEVIHADFPSTASPKRLDLSQFAAPLGAAGPRVGVGTGRRARHVQRPLALDARREFERLGEVSAACPRR